jgi:tetratricopeptide (TPR) repeat protein
VVSLLMSGVMAVIAPTASPQSGGLPQNISRLYNSAEYGHAAEALDSAIAANPQNASLYYWRGRCYYEMHDFSGAISNFEHAVMLEQDRAEFHVWLGRASGRKAEEQGRFNPFSGFNLARRTRHEFETAVRLDPKNVEAQRDFIRYLGIAPGIVGGSEEHAQTQIAALSAIDPIEADLARAEFYSARNKPDLATAEYQKILQKTPPRISVCYEIADYFRDHGNPTLMEQAVQAAAKLDPNDPKLRYYRGVALVLANRDLPQAERDLREYLAKVMPNAEVPPHWSAHQWLGRLYEKQNQFDKAAAEYEAALELDPRNKDLRDALKRAENPDRK